MSAVYLAPYVPDEPLPQAHRRSVWRAAIGLQDVDGLSPSPYLIQTAQEQIQGILSIENAEKNIRSFYRRFRNRKAGADGTMEADLVAVHIVASLEAPGFHFSPGELQSIHRRLFAGVLDHPGTIRNYDITKNEWVLDGDTVSYAPCEYIQDAMDRLFIWESCFSYSGRTPEEIIQHLCQFTASLWQIHAFGEGNTRSTSVFLLRYLHFLGFHTRQDVFAENSWYFRNALVRASYQDLPNGIRPTIEFLIPFFQNLLLGMDNPLQNRTLHIHFEE